ncbi:tyrosinase [Macroventuria anomochaeta]|uniref:Tyrosinase n=1 Tax=Macroventuria anomochaeta TaxID=301207 RepID=A0ACB6RLP9_9PLEO|nr:tyrosinase [Macroventuria anomochaeta]KAF2622028.1 tyrosinase [Macroventuria anomochaeta]
MFMSWASWLLAALTFVSVVTCTPATPNSKRQSGSGIVTGIESRDLNGNPFLRLEVRDMRANYPDQWNLYLLGLDQLHTTSQKEPNSYYGLAGIHGKPYQTWLNAPGISYKIGSSGYCPHSMALFLGWHRPYLALFEQELYARIQRIAEYASADQIERYRWAAYSFRIPYWDWSQGEQSGNVPDFFMTETTVVTTPEGRNIEIWNPLYKYEFKPVPSAGAFDGKWSQINTTIRWPASNSPWEESRQSEFAASFVNLRRQIQDQTALAFRQGTLNGFWEAIEMVHGWVHGAIGGGYSTGFGGTGHMWPLEYSSYEPLFWLHHTNVDRLFALYQAQNPGAYLQPSNVGSAGNVFVEDNTVVDGDTPLLPFRHNPGSFWTTNEAMDWRLFGYDYPETQSANTASAQATVAQLYSGSVRGRVAAGQTGGVGHHFMPGMEESSYTDWVINTAAAPLDLPPTFVVQFSLVGDFSSDASTDVGMWSVLMPMDHNKAKRSLREAEKLTKRATAADMTLHGTVSLTSSLLDQIDAGKLQSLDEQDVVPFLREKLTWKVYSGDGTQLSDSSLDAIRIDIASEIARIPSDPSAPIEYSNDAIAHSEVTAGKMGGAS